MEPEGWEQPLPLATDEDFDAPAQPEATDARRQRELELGIADDVDWCMSVLAAGPKPLLKRCFFNGAQALLHRLRGGSASVNAAAPPPRRPAAAQPATTCRRC